MERENVTVSQQHPKVLLCYYSISFRESQERIKTMENVITKTNEQFGSIRTIEGKPQLWCGSDVAKALGYSNTRDALARHCKGVVKHDTLTSKGTQKLSFIPEADVYRLICHSKLPKAQEF